MSAALARRIAADVGPEHARDLVLERESGEQPVRVRFRVDYPSIWHRGLGRDPNVKVLAIEIERDFVLQSVRLSEISDTEFGWILEQLEDDEELNAPLDGM